jgi:hypothetical protein
LQRERVQERAVSAETWAETAMQMNSFKPGESAASKAERYCDAVCGEMALATMTVQADALACRLRLLAAREPASKVFSAQPRDRAAKFGLRPPAEAAVLSDETGGVNLGRFPCGAEMQAEDWSVDGGAVRGYVVCLAAMLDGLTVRGVLAACAGDDKDRETVEADAKRFRDKILSLRVPLVPADAAAFLLRQQDILSHHVVLALQRAREAFLGDADTHAVEVTDAVLALLTGTQPDADSENLLWRGLPAYPAHAAARALGPCGVLVERSVWGRAAGLVGLLGMKQRKTVLSQWQLVELMLQTRMRNRCSL